MMDAQEINCGTELLGAVDDEKFLNFLFNVDCKILQILFLKMIYFSTTGINILFLPYS